MQSKSKKQELKIHLLFAGVLVLALVITAGLKVWRGTEITTALWQTLTGIRPMELALLIGFWYQGVAGRRHTEVGSWLTRLHLND